MISIRSALKTAEKNLIPVSDTPLLDAEILLAHVLNVNRSYLYSHSDDAISDEKINAFHILLEKRIQGEPIAYLTGHHAFWSFDLIVTPDTLIPRSDTECLVEQALRLLPDDNYIVADLGTGSGAIALAIASEKPNSTIYATDKSSKTLHVAKKNAERLAIKNIVFSEGDWCDALPDMLFDCILSNPPYIAENDQHLASLTYEPRSALVSGEDGLNDIRLIVQAAKKHLKPGGLLLLEHGWDQAARVREIFEQEKYYYIQSFQDVGCHDRVTGGLFYP